MLLLVPLALAAADPTRESLVARFDAHLAHDGADGCLTGLVAELKGGWAHLTPEDRRRMTAALAPWKADLLDPVDAGGTPAPPGGYATDSCFGQQLTNRLAGEHFVVEWDDDIDEDTAQDFLDALEEGWAVEVDTLGWNPPDGAGDYLLPAYVAAGNYQSAYTTVDSCGSQWVPYIVAYAGSFSQMSWADTMAVHEFNHALQFSYGQAMEFWWWEATATWIESEVYPGVDWWSYYVSGYTQNPQIAMSASSQEDQDVFYHMYGMAVWAFYLSDYQGGPDVIRQTWEAASHENGAYGFTQEDALDAIGIDFDAAYLDFIVRNSVMDYAEQDSFPRIRMDDVDELPASDESRSSTEPEGRGQHYFEISKGLGEGDLVFSLTSEDSVDWAVALVAVDDDEIVTSVVATLEDGTGSVTLPGYGSDDVVVVVSPLSSRDDSFEYAWTAALAEPALADDGADEKVGLGSCGCSTGGAGSGASIGATLAMLALARRRRR